VPGVRLHSLRKALRLSLREVSRGIGVSHETVARYERGVPMDDGRMHDLAIYLGAKGGVDPEEVLRYLQGLRDTLRLSPIIDGRSSQ
jgi:transcriptional regulator with XRE-family HTH domain